MVTNVLYVLVLQVLLAMLKARLQALSRAYLIMLIVLEKSRTVTGNDLWLHPLALNLQTSFRPKWLNRRMGAGGHFKAEILYLFIDFSVLCVSLELFYLEVDDDGYWCRCETCTLKFNLWSSTDFRNGGLHDPASFIATTGPLHNRDAGRFSPIPYLWLGFDKQIVLKIHRQLA